MVTVMCYIFVQDGEENGIKRCLLCAHNWNTRALEFYKHRGAYNWSSRDNVSVFKVENPELKTKNI